MAIKKSFHPNLGVVFTYCSKPNCDRSHLHRHHIKHEALWIHMKVTDNESRRMKGWTPEFKEKLKTRYDLFLPEDVSVICAWHHAEIHFEYDRLIEKDQMLKKYKALGSYSVAEAKALMKKFRRHFNVWIKKTTPGLDPAFLVSMRAFPLSQGEMKR